MKKFFSLFLILALMLTGCANEEPDGTSSIETEATGYYEPASQIETQTAGAVLQYALPDSGYRWIKNMADQLLLATDTDESRLLVLSGENCIPVANHQLDADMLMGCRAMFNGFAYYDKTSHCVYYLDQQMNQVQSVSLTEEMTTPVISDDGSHIYYCVGKEIRALDVTRKLTRLVKSLNTEKQTLTGTCFGGKVLVCNSEDSQGVVNTLYISTENGQTLKTDNSILSMDTYENTYLVQRVDGQVQQWIVGALDGEAKQLNISDDNVVSALQLNGVIGYGVDDDGLHLNFYSLTDGKATARISIPGDYEPKAFLADKWTGAVWILTVDADGDRQLLLRWNMGNSAVQEEDVYIGTLFTNENPDTQSFSAIKDRIQKLNKRYGVRIRIWKEAVKSPGEHILVSEHQVSSITSMLDQLEAVLKEFPKNFVSKSVSTKLRICLVRSVDAEAKAIQYWDGKYAFIALSTGVDVRTEFLKAFGSVVDSHVLGNSAKYDYWDTLNPESFVYGDTVDETLITGENRAFADLESMKSGTVDRSRIFLQAMLPENADTFKSEIMQKKLTMLCKAIRDAWNTERSTDLFPWEQYLAKPIAKKK